MTDPSSPRRRPTFVFFGGLFSAFFLAFGFPPGGHRLIGWFALVPLFASLHRQREHVGLRALHAATFATILLGWFAVDAYRTGWETRPIGAVLGGDGVALAITVASWIVFGVVTGPLLRGPSWATLLGLPAVWTALEYLRVEATPWVSPFALIATSIRPDSPEAQVTSVVGVLGLGFVVVLVNALFLLVVATRRVGRQLGWLVAALAVVLGLTLGGRAALPEWTESGELNIALVQTVGTAPAPDQMVARLGHSLLESSPELIVFPSRAFPARDGNAIVAEAIELARRARLHVAVGVARGDPPRAAVVVVGPGLDPPVEFRPSRDLASSTIDDRAAGSPVVMSTLQSTLGILVGADAYAAGPCRAAVRSGAEAIVAVGDDPIGWGVTVPLGLLRLTALRAVETRRWIVRSNRDGWSAVFSPHGADTLRAPPGNEWAAVERVQPRSDVSFAVRWGGWAGPIAAGLAIAILAVLRARAATTPASAPHPHGTSGGSSA